MSNEGHSKVIGKGNVDIMFTFGRTITLTNILNVLEMNKNLESGNLFGKLSIKSDYKSKNLVLSQNGKFV